jgi:hypothetical protein
VLLAFLISGTITGCRASDGEEPLRQADGSATSCFAKHGASNFILGDDVLVNAGDVPLTIDSVALTGADNLRLTDAFVAPVPARGSYTLMGTVTGVPWDFYAATQEPLWRTRVQAVSAVVAPASDGTSLNLLVVTRALVTNKTSTAGGIEVRYHDSRRTYVWHSTVTYRAVPRRSC